MKISTQKKIKGILTGLLEEDILAEDPRNYSVERVFSSKGGSLPQKTQVLFDKKKRIEKKRLSIFGKLSPRKRVQNQCPKQLYLLNENRLALTR